MRLKQLLLAVTCLSLVFAGALAQGQAVDPMQEEIFHSLDKNRDGKLTLEEFAVIWKDPKVAADTFRQWDANRDGVITLGEFVRFQPGAGPPPDKE